MRYRTASGARRVAATFVAVASFASSGCATSTVPTGTNPISQPPAPTLTAPPDVLGSAGSCQPGSPRTELPSGIEIEGINDEGRVVYALFAADEIRPLTPTTVYWHVNGDGAFRLTLVGPDGQITKITDVRPGQLNGWDRPGEPWVGPLTFPVAGCWRVYFTRGRVAGDLWVQVA